MFVPPFGSLIYLVSLKRLLQLTGQHKDTATAVLLLLLHKPMSQGQVDTILHSILNLRRTLVRGNGHIVHDIRECQGPPQDHESGEDLVAMVHILATTGDRLCTGKLQDR